MIKNKKNNRFVLTICIEHPVSSYKYLYDTVALQYT